MIYYTEEKNGTKSIYYKVIYDEIEGKEISKAKVEIPLHIKEINGQTRFILYDDEMNVLSTPTSYINFHLKGTPNSKKLAATALRLLYIFLALSGYSIDELEFNQLKQLNVFLLGINSNPENYKTITVRTNETVNNYLAVYRAYFKANGFKSEALFDSKTIKVLNQFGNDSIGESEHITYTNNVRTGNYKSKEVPKHIRPDDFNKLYDLAKKNEDILAQCIMRLMYCHGLRIGEVLGLTIEDVYEKKDENDGFLYPVVALRNRVSDKNFQYAKNLGHIFNTSYYDTKRYKDTKVEVAIDYPLFDLLCDYIESAHKKAKKDYPENYATGIADIVTSDFENETNHYIFLNKWGRVLSGQTWGLKLKEYFTLCSIHVDKKCKESNLSHRFRHGYAMMHAYYRKNPYDLAMLADKMRHKNPKTTMKYFSPTLETKFKIKNDFSKELYELVPSLKEGAKLYE